MTKRDSDVPVHSGPTGRLIAEQCLPQEEAHLWERRQEVFLTLPFLVYLYSGSTKTFEKNRKSPVVEIPIVVRYQVEDLRKVLSICVFSPIWENDSFPRGATDRGLKSWAAKGARKMDLYTSQKVLMTSGGKLILHPLFVSYMQTTTFERFH